MYDSITVTNDGSVQFADYIVRTLRVQVVCCVYVEIVCIYVVMCVYVHVMYLCVRVCVYPCICLCMHINEKQHCLSLYIVGG